MSNFERKNAALQDALSKVKSKIYQNIAEEVKNDILLNDQKSLTQTRKKLELSRKKLSMKNTKANKQKVMNIDVILNTMDHPEKAASPKQASPKPVASPKAASPKAASPKPVASPKKGRATKRAAAKKATSPKNVTEKSKPSVRLVNVKGDGNCFYRSLYQAAKNHTKGDLSPKVYELFTKTHAEAVDEETFMNGVRKGTADMIAKGIFKDINEYAKDAIRANASYVTKEGRAHALSTQLEFFEDMRQSAFSKADSRILFENWIEESASQIQNAFSLSKFKRKFKKPSDAPKFYKALAKIVADSGVYASQSDIDVVKYVLTKAHMQVHPDTLKPSIFYPEKDGVTHLWLKKVGEHYQFWKLINY